MLAFFCITQFLYQVVFTWQYMIHRHDFKEELGERGFLWRSLTARGERSYLPKWSYATFAMELLPHSRIWGRSIGMKIYNFSILSLRMRTRRVLWSRPRISAALFLPLIFHWVCSSTRKIYSRSLCVNVSETPIPPFRWFYQLSCEERP